MIFEHLELAILRKKCHRSKIFFKVLEYFCIIYSICSFLKNCIMHPLFKKLGVILSQNTASGLINMIINLLQPQPVLTCSDFPSRSGRDWIQNRDVLLQLFACCLQFILGRAFYIQVAFHPRSGCISVQGVCARNMVNCIYHALWASHLHSYWNSCIRARYCYWFY